MKRHQHPRPPRDSLFLCLPRILRNEGAEGSTLHFREPFNESLLRARNVAQEGKRGKEKERERKYSYNSNERLLRRKTVFPVFVVKRHM